MAYGKIGGRVFVQIESDEVGPLSEEGIRKGLERFFVQITRASAPRKSRHGFWVGDPRGTQHLGLVCPGMHPIAMLFFDV